jgi:RNA polymerase-binding transcription factor DksA
MFSKDQLDFYKKQLESEKEKIQQGLSGFGVAKENDPNNYDSYIPEMGLSEEENVQEVAEYINRVASEELLEDRLKEIQQALHKIKVGTFGVCEECKKEIEAKKLEINPAADFCIECTKGKK